MLITLQDYSQPTGAMLHRREKAAVVGGGLSGLWISYELVRRGYDVTLYEANSVGYGASSRAAGIISLQLPKSLLGYAIEGVKAYAELGVERMTKTVWIPRPEELHCIKDIISTLRLEGIDADVLRLEELRELNLRLAGDNDLPVSIMVQGVVSPGDALGHLTKVLADASFTLKEGPVIRKGDRLFYNGLEVEADLKFIAAGPWTPELIGLRDNFTIYRCSAHSVRGQTPNVIVEDDINGFYMVPEAEGQAIVGGGDSQLVRPEDGFRLSQGEAYEVLELAAARLPDAENFYPVSSWAAPCISASDGMPVVGELNGYYILAGLDGAGLTLSPGLARLVVDVAEGASKEDGRLSPRRLLHGKLKGPREPFDRLCEC
jgi:glycine/D-amino acid oxidase-like deaminating enzyme